MAKYEKSNNSCWWCNMIPIAEEDEKLWYEYEFDSYVHPSCVKRNYEKLLNKERDIFEEWSFQEAMIMYKELLESGAYNDK